MKHNIASFSLGQKAEPFVFEVDSLFYYLEALTDRRKPKGVRYPLAVALVFVILAKLAGENDPEGIAHWVWLRKQMLIESLKLKRDTLLTRRHSLEYLAGRLMSKSFSKRSHSFCYRLWKEACL